MEPTLTPAQERRLTLHSWVMVIALAASFVVWGVFVFLTVGDKNPPAWDFDVVEDIPGQSPYSSHHPQPLFTTPAPLEGQHVPGVFTNPQMTPGKNK